eukprot:1524738-Pyramimonas_sp.AAC.1
MPGHVLIPGKCKFAKPWQLPDNHGQAPPVPAEPATGPETPVPAEPAAPPPEASAAPSLTRLRAPRPGSRAGPTAGASGHDMTVGRHAAEPAAVQHLPRVEPGVRMTTSDCH